MKLVLCRKFHAQTQSFAFESFVLAFFEFLMSSFGIRKFRQGKVSKLLGLRIHLTHWHTFIGGKCKGGEKVRLPLIVASQLTAKVTVVLPDSLPFYLDLEICPIGGWGATR